MSPGAAPGRPTGSPRGTGDRDGDVAVVGIACRFPGGEDKDGFWDLLCRGADSVGPVPSSRWAAARFYSADGAPGRINNELGSFLPDLEAFDHAFFAIGGEDAAAMDPQQRLVLASAWHALEDAGVDPRALSGRPCGVYLGVMGNDWIWRTALSAGRAFGARQGAGTGQHMVANRLSYQLNLRGPSLTVDAACSSSLVAVHLAATAVAAGECDYALAGGVNAMLQPTNGIYFTLLGLSAPDGRCKPFSVEADGMGRGEGVGVVVLRPLAAARADGQRVYAVVRGAGVSHNGRSNGITAPARWGQQDAIEAAYRRAGVTPAQVSFVEAHGTGTLIGDAIEINALSAVHAVPREVPCAVGSVKGNIGHTEGAAGIASFIKAALALYHRVVPPSLHSAPVNPALGLGGNGLRLASEPVALGAGEVTGAVSAFGLGGTNAHVVLASDACRPVPPTPGPGVFTFSAPDPEALCRNLLAQADHLDRRDDRELAALCHTSNRSRASGRHRYAVVADSRGELVAALRRAARQPPAPRPARHRAAALRVGLLLPDAEPEVPTALLAARSAAFRAARAAWPAVAPADATVRAAASTHAKAPAHVEGPAQAEAAPHAVGGALGRALLALGVTPTALFAESGAGGAAVAALAAGVDVRDASGLPSAGLTHLVTLGSARVPPAAAGGADVVHVALVEPGDRDAWYGLARAAACLYRAGLDLCWDELYRPDQRVVRCLAPYRFADTRLPLPPAADQPASPAAAN